jgi:hypothetical protein
MRKLLVIAVAKKGNKAAPKTPIAVNVIRVEQGWWDRMLAQLRQKSESTWIAIKVDLC